MGRRARPVELYVLGNPRKGKQATEVRRQAEEKLRPAADAVKPPAWLSREARREWRRVMGEVGKLGLITNADVSVLARYCDAMARYADAACHIQEEGAVIEQPGRGRIVNPWVRVAETYARMAHQAETALGLDPTARAALAKAIAAAGGQQQRDEFEEEFGGVGTAAG